jgi:hypothetical protein
LEAKELKALSKQALFRSGSIDRQQCQRRRRKEEEGEVARAAGKEVSGEGYGIAQSLLVCQGRRRSVATRRRRGDKEVCRFVSSTRKALAGVLLKQDWSGVLDGAREEDAGGKLGCVGVVRARGQRARQWAGNERRAMGNGKREQIETRGGRRERASRKGNRRQEDKREHEATRDSRREAMNGRRQAGETRDEKENKRKRERCRRRRRKKA